MYYRDCMLVLMKTSNRVVWASPLSIRPKLMTRTNTKLVEYNGFFPESFGGLSTMVHHVLQGTCVMYSLLSGRPEKEVAYAELAHLKYQAQDMIRRVVEKQRDRYSKCEVLQDRVYLYKAQEARDYLAANTEERANMEYRTRYLRLEAGYRKSTLEQAANTIVFAHELQGVNMYASEAFRFEQTRLLESIDNAPQLRVFINSLETKLVDIGSTVAAATAATE